jgi:AraC-like DNA-binding protein
MLDAAPASKLPMDTAVMLPSAALRPYIQRFLIVEYKAGWSTTLLPGTGLVAAFRFKGECLLNGAKAPNALVTGIWDHTRILIHSGKCANVLAMFTPTGAAAFFREPVEGLFNQTMPYELEVRRSELSLVEEQISESADHRDRVRAVEHFLLQQSRYQVPDPLISFAVGRIRATHGSMRIDHLARHLGLSQSAIERRFRRTVGTSPKKFAALVRLRHVVRLHRTGATFTEIAHAAGYSDQSHFIKDFRRFTGEPPESFFQTATAFC